jgi:hypothetical protein
MLCDFVDVEVADRFGDFVISRHDFLGARLEVFVFWAWSVFLVFSMTWFALTVCFCGSARRELWATSRIKYPVRDLKA